MDDKHILAACVACGLHPELLETSTTLELRGVGFELHDIDREIISLVRSLVCFPDILVMVNTNRMSDVQFARIACLLQAFCRVHKAEDLFHLPFATAQLLQRCEQYVASTKGHDTSQAEFAVAQAAKLSVESANTTGPWRQTGFDVRAAQEFLGRPPQRTIIWPTDSKHLRLMDRLGLDKRLRHCASEDEEERVADERRYLNQRKTFDKVRAVRETQRVARLFGSMVNTNLIPASAIPGGVDVHLVGTESNTETEDGNGRDDPDDDDELHYLRPATILS